MAFRATILSREVRVLGFRLNSIRGNHVPLPAPLERVMDHKPEIQLSLPESDREIETNNKIEIPTFSFTGSMELMAVPKKKVSKHKRGIRNGPKALKPIPVIVRCRSCGRVKLPHFFCCSGERGIPGERNDST